jgi:hypothetical protein
MLTSSKAIITGIGLLVVIALLSARAQFFGGDGYSRSFQIRDPELIREKAEMEKALDPKFTEDVFTFARLHFGADLGGRFGGGRLWDDDTPEADLNLVYRLTLKARMRLPIQPGFLDLLQGQSDRHELRDVLPDVRDGES